MNIFCLLSGHVWISNINIEKVKSFSISEKTGIFDFGIKRKRICKNCGCKQFFSDKGWEKEPLTKKELRDKKIKKLLK